MLRQRGHQVGIGQGGDDLHRGINALETEGRVNRAMSRPAPRVLGIIAPAPRLTPLGAALLALAVALPGGALVAVLAWLAGF